MGTYRECELVRVSRAVSFIIAFAALSAGCAAPASTRDAAGALPIPSAAGVELHANALNISMPAGESSLVVLLNVTKDMWVHWKTPVLKAEDAAWTVCVVVQPVGIGPGNRVKWAILELSDSTLTSANPRSRARSRTSRM